LAADRSEVLVWHDIKAGFVCEGAVRGDGSIRDLLLGVTPRSTFTVAPFAKDKRGLAEGLLPTLLETFACQMSRSRPLTAPS
jgi:hypothetical protein